MTPCDLPAAAWLRLSAGGLLLRRVDLVRARTTIGRRPYTDIPLIDLTVSGEHALILRQDEHWLLRDQRSRNGTTVNGQPVTEHRLSEGDVIGIGGYRLAFGLTSDAAIRAGRDRPAAAATEPGAAMIRSRVRA